MSKRKIDAPMMDTESPMMDIEAPVAVEPAAVAGPAPGPEEARALRYMHEVERHVTGPNQHIIAHEQRPGWFDVVFWNGGLRAWRPWRGTVGQGRATVIRLLAAECAVSNVTLMEEPVDFSLYDGVDPAEFDTLIAESKPTLLCDEGAPGQADGWVSIALDGFGPTTGPHPGARFPRATLKDRFLTLARVDLPVALGVNAFQDRGNPVMVRHDVAARNLLPPERWGIQGRPDLAARAIDREVALNAACRAEADRMWREEGRRMPADDQWRQEAKRFDRERAPLAA